jgi:8-oxo-dGTP diphosphatase
MFWYPKEEDYDVRDSEGTTLRDFLGSYDPHKYELPAVTVDNLILKQEAQGYKILLIRRGRHPSFGMLALPGGFIEMNESLEESAARELFEETGIKGIPLKQLGAYGEVGRDPRLRIISVAYLSIITNDIEFHAGDDAADADFYTVSARKYLKNMETNYIISFQNKSGRASATIRETGAKRSIVDSDIASDHSIMILDALESLGLIDNM